ncbi:MAG: tetratricopeptide repeat protein [Gemmatimonadetes bacterium]|nr:tetratricopeptide repeat protein [Gemmatimonadota bacterium]
MNRISRLHLTSIVLLAVFGMTAVSEPAYAQAQAQTQLPGNTRKQPLEPQELAFQRRLDEANRSLRRGNAASARRTFEILLKERPDHHDAFVGYVTARIDLYELEGLADLVQRKAEFNPNDADYVLLMGDVYAAGGDGERALTIWKGALSMFPDETAGYREIGDRMANRRMVPEAIQWFEDARATLNSKNRFARNLASLYDLLGEGDRVAEELVRAVVEGTMKDSEMLRRLKELRVDGDLDAYPYGLLQTALRENPDLGGLREVLGSLLLDDRRCGDALNHYVELDNSGRTCGAFLLPFARTASARGCVDAATEALEALLAKCERPTVRIESQFMLASIYRKDGQADRAAGVYQSLLDNTKNPGDRSRANYELGMLYLEDLGDAKKAIPILNELLRGKQGVHGTEARFALARAYLLDTETERAVREYQAIETEAADDLMRERAIYLRGEAQYYAGDIDGALASYREVIDRFPTGDYVNDALEQSIFLSEHRDAGDIPLREYATCLLMIDRHEFREARARLEELFSSLLVSKLRDDFAWQLAVIEEEEGRYESAIEQLQSIVTDFAGERLAQAAHVKIGDLYGNNLQNLPQAIAQYESFLLEHPGSILSDEVRRKKREAEAQNEL